MTNLLKKQKIKYLLILVLLFISVPITFGQNLLTDIKNKTVSECIRIEMEAGSSFIENKNTYLSGKGIEQPIRFLRKDTILPDLIVAYFYYTDSTIAYIKYEWDVKNMDNSDNNPQSEEVQNAFIEKYQSLEKEFTIKYGTSKVSGNLTDMELINQKAGLRKKNIWLTNDNIEIEMYIVITNYYEKKGIITYSPTHKIRVYVRNKN